LCQHLEQNRIPDGCGSGSLYADEQERSVEFEFDQVAS
jgi:hypothetical protein